MKLETLVKEFLFECEIREYSGMTVENYRKQLRHFTDFLKEQFEICELEEMKPTHVKAFIKHYQLRQCKPSYVNDNLKAVKVLCAYAYKEKYVDYLITAEIKNVKEPKTLIHTFSREEIKKMISYYHGSNYVDIRNKLILMMLFDSFGLFLLFISILSILFISIFIFGRFCSVFGNSSSVFGLLFSKFGDSQSTIPYSFSKLGFGDKKK